MREHVDLPILEALTHEWAKAPPVHRLVAAYMKYEPPRPAGKPGEVNPEVRGLLPAATTRLTPIDTSLWDTLQPPAAAEKDRNG